ncbi:MAG: HAD family hydrolase [Candidatus Wallbacteria bacterium]|nr:HAD family hydrolase [Candidatus Wallbacteria bacterium]
MGISPLMRRAVFLDRDGVINRALMRDGKPYPPHDLLELEILPGVEAALKSLHDAGFKLIVVTNQPDVARGSQTRAMVEKINAELRSSLPIDDFKVCYHDDSDQCQCRKPRTGSLVKSAQEFGISLKESFMIGDRWRDIEAGRNAGCRTILIDYHYTELKQVEPDCRACNITSAVEWIFKQKGESNEEN